MFTPVENGGGDRWESRTKLGSHMSAFSELIKWGVDLILIGFIKVPWDCEAAAGAIHLYPAG